MSRSNFFVHDGIPAALITFLNETVISDTQELSDGAAAAQQLPPRLEMTHLIKADPGSDPARLCPPSPPHLPARLMARRCRCSRRESVASMMGPHGAVRDDAAAFSGRNLERTRPSPGGHLPRLGGVSREENNDKYQNVNAVNIRKYGNTEK